MVKRELIMINSSDTVLEYEWIRLFANNCSNYSTVYNKTSVQQIGQRQTESTNRKAPLMQHMNNVTHPT